METIFNWIAGVEPVLKEQAKEKKKPRHKNEVELQAHVIVARDGLRYCVYTHNFRKSILPTEDEKQRGQIYWDKCRAIAAGRHLLRGLHSTQEHPTLVM